MGLFKKGKAGGSTSGRMEKTPARLKRERNKRKREEARWQRLNGPVFVRKQDEDPRKPK